jgi:predicted nuclease of predicted toxin-antitoxin system
MARLYADENVPLAVVEELRSLGHDVATVHETGKSNRATPDSEILDFAVAQSRVVLTLNRKHFVALHSARPGHAGIVVCTVDVNFVRQARLIHEALRGHENLSGCLLRINRPRS